MGSEFDYRIFDDTDRAGLNRSFKEACEDARFESGHGGYTGTIAEMHSIATVKDLRLNSLGEARAYLEQHHQKWDGAMAVSYYKPQSPSDLDRKAVLAAEEKVTRWQDRLRAGEKAILDKFLGRRVSTVGCVKCNSRFNFTVMQESARRLLRPLKDATGRTLGVMAVTCPLCGEHLIPSADRERLLKLQQRLDDANKELRDARAPKPGKTLSWVVGGWCSS